jgi:hypothetical protein
LIDLDPKNNEAYENHLFKVDQLGLEYDDHVTSPVRSLRIWRYYEYMALHTEEAVPKEAMLKAFEELALTFQDDPVFVE